MDLSEIRLLLRRLRNTRPAPHLDAKFMDMYRERVRGGADEKERARAAGRTGELRSPKALQQRHGHGEFAKAPPPRHEPL